ncbi:3' terminal RNA ribose 2'-O-methyltransferase Hen1 [Gordonia sp. CPCC 205515]|uniref:3' terminal RNA ribose 2'-O-methyltransferase Hen1 n=1 Tax=Gordonia sp. CPCC 205515 TaxID=3140791 RepID=UPI003AF38F83
MMTLEVHGGQTPATDLGYLLHKHPDSVQTFDTSQGLARVFYPVASAEQCRVVLHVDGSGVRPHTDTDRYVNTIPYAASSRFVVALGKVFGDAVAGRCANRPDLVDHAWPELTLTVPSVPTDGRLDPAELFAPLGWSVDVTPQSLRPVQWGDSGFVTLTLHGQHTIRDALRQLCVLLPVLAGDKHYFVDEDEIGKLERLGAGWLPTHPLAEQIISGYVKRVRPLVDQALARLVVDADDSTTITPRRETLARQRRLVVAELVRASRARSVLDIGCGEGRLLGELVADRHLNRLAGVDVSPSALNRAGDRLQRWRDVELWQSSLLYTDPRCRGFDAAVLMEVIEHIDFERLPVAVASVFGTMAPRVVIVTTPNRDHNPQYGLSANEFRHPDHRFEFTRTEFARWCDSVAAGFTYSVTRGEIGEPVDGVGAPTQTAVFTRIDEVSP